jgi:hypothetical protein
MARPGAKPAPVVYCSSGGAELNDSDHVGAHSVTAYERASESIVLLRSDTTAYGYEPIERQASDGGLHIVAERVEVQPR